MGRKITIEPVTRVEGHGKVTIHLDDDNIAGLFKVLSAGVQLIGPFGDVCADFVRRADQFAGPTAQNFGQILGPRRGPIGR